MCQATSSNTDQPHKKSVSFAKDPNDRRAVKVQVKFIDTKLATEEQKRMMFYSKKEKQRIQQSAQKLANQVSMQDRCNHFNNEMGHIDNSKFDYCPILLRAFRSCNRKAENLTDQERHYLTEWMIYGDNRRGLERYSINKLHVAMQKRKKRAITTVLKMQADAAANGSPPNNDEWIAAVYCELSAQSKRFSTLMGQVDEGAAMRGVKIDEYAGYLPQSSTPSSDERRGSF